MLGISRHGQRIISKYSSDEIQLRKAFWSLFAAHLLTASISICCYFCFILFFVKSNTNIFLIQTLYVLSAFFDVTWLFYGLENFRSVVIKNAGVKVLAVSYTHLDVYKRQPYRLSGEETRTFSFSIRMLQNGRTA